MIAEYFDSLWITDVSWFRTMEFQMLNTLTMQAHNKYVEHGKQYRAANSCMLAASFLKPSYILNPTI